MPSQSATTRKTDQKAIAARIRAYIAALPPDARRSARTLRATIRSVVPGAVEVFSYGIPGFRFEDRALVWYAGWRHHVSLYPIGTALRQMYAADLDGYKTSKGTVQFPLDQPLPVALIRRLVKARVAQMRRGDRV
jgi:uncharacterized protein YdhG (YjbR/CyaY superfamily)